jgi:HicA toxin of bacterial toxin-antitoxin,
VVRVKGSHHFIRHSDGRATVVPVHAGETLGPRLLASILRDLKLTREQLQKLLEGSAMASNNRFERSRVAASIRAAQPHR